MHSLAQTAEGLFEWPAGSSSATEPASSSGAEAEHQGPCRAPTPPRQASPLRSLTELIEMAVSVVVSAVSGSARSQRARRGSSVIDAFSVSRKRRLKLKDVV